MGKKIHLLNWKIITLPKKIGGLQIRDAKHQNIALLSSIAWPFHSPTNNYIWKLILNTKYL